MLILEGWNNRKSRNALFLTSNITEFFEDCFVGHDVMLYRAYRVGQKRLGGRLCQAIVCIISYCMRELSY